MGTYFSLTLELNAGSFLFSVDMIFTATSHVGHLEAAATREELEQKLAQTTEAGSFSRMS
jgi:RNase P protein component